MQPDATTRLLSGLRRLGRTRIPLQMLRDIFAKTCPELNEQPDRRIFLSQLIQKAASAGAIIVPIGRDGWERRPGADLPKYIKIDRRQKKPAKSDVPMAWHPALAFAAQERNVRRIATLKRLNDWLKLDPDLSISVPIKERSLEIFGDEKRLDSLRSGLNLFEGNLSLADLGCRICPIPLPYESGPAYALGRPILIVENNDTWASFSNWNAQAGHFSAVAYAGGGHSKGLGYDENFLDTLLRRYAAERIYYFGDLDPRGIRIAAQASRRREARGACPILPAEPFYAWLIANGTRTSLHSKEQLSQQDLEWVSASLRPEVLSLFQARRRIPQEALGTRVLSIFAFPGIV